MIIPVEERIDTLLTANSIHEGLETAATNVDATAHFYLEDGPVSFTISELLSTCGTGRALLADRGVGKGDRVGILGSNDHHWARWAFSVWSAGAVAVPLPVPIRLRDADAISEQVRSLATASGCKAVAAHPMLAWTIPQELLLPWEMPAIADSAEPASGITRDDIAVIQLTSGSTAFPKGAVLSHHAVLTGCWGGLTSYEASDDMVVVGWLPFFHDMGLFATLVSPFIAGLNVHLLPPERFARAPGEWFRLASRVGATMTIAPPTAWAAAVRAVDRDPGGVEDLSLFTTAALAAESIEPEVVERVLEVGGRFGLPREAVGGAYGLAETTLGVTVTYPGEGPAFDTIDLEILAERGEAIPPRGGGPEKRLTSCGRTMPGVEMRVVGPDGSPLPERHAGEIHVQSPTLMEGYMDVPEADQPFTDDGWLRTGDIGYVADERLYVTGREKDLLIVLGRNYVPEDIEWAAARVEGVRAGRVVAFGRPGGGDADVIVAVEPTRQADPEKLPLLVRRMISDSVGIRPREVLVLAPGTIEKTTSGKLRRRALRDSYERGALEPLATGPGGVDQRQFRQSFRGDRRGRLIAIL
ncbi:MAG TPA: AMP-binding protein [Actinomycetota bacterium]|nr:AMP-binding protein [Actinomycetota bacterium]